MEGEKTEDVDADRQPREHEHTRVLLGVAGETDAAAQRSRTLVSQRASKRAGEQKCTTFEAVPTILLDQVILPVVWKVVEAEGLKSDICDEGIDEEEHPQAKWKSGRREVSASELALGQEEDDGGQQDAAGEDGWCQHPEGQLHPEAVEPEARKHTRCAAEANAHADGECTEQLAHLRSQRDLVHDVNLCNQLVEACADEPLGVSCAPCSRQDIGHLKFYSGRVNILHLTAEVWASGAPTSTLSLVSGVVAREHRVIVSLTRFGSWRRSTRSIARASRMTAAITM